MKTMLIAGACALAATTARADDAPLSQIVVTAPGAAAIDAPATSQSITAEAIVRTVNLVTPEDALRYLPDIVIRQRHIGDTQSPVTTRTSGVGASARSLIYVDGMLISALIGNNNTSASPKWGLVTPDAISRVDVLYGPFSAAYAGNSIGEMIAFTTHMPDKFEASAEAQGAIQSFAKYGDRKDYGTARVAADLGDRFGAFAFRLSYNHLDSVAQPLTYATATVPSAAGASGTPVTGAFLDANKTGQPIAVLGSTAIEHQVQDNASGRFAYDFTSALTGAYTYGVFANDDGSTVDSYLRDASGQPVYSGTVNMAGRSYALAPATFSGGLYALSELQLAQGLSLASHTGGVFDFELLASDFDYLHSRQRIAATAPPAAFVGGAGTDTSLDSTGWHTLDAIGTWRPAANLVTFGLQDDVFTLDNPKYALADWTRPSDGAVQAASRGHTETLAVWAQDVWAVRPGLKLTVGGRWEHWRAFGGVNYSLSPALNVAQPSLQKDAFSPKGVLAWTPMPGWAVKGSAGVAYRFPTVSELYQAVTAGPILAVPDPNLLPEQALSSELSAERVWSNASLRLSLFDERIHNALISQTGALAGAPATFVQNIDRTHATGVELVADRRDAFVRGLELSGWVTFVDARIDKDVLPRGGRQAAAAAAPPARRRRGVLFADGQADGFPGRPLQRPRLRQHRQHRPRRQHLPGLLGLLRDGRQGQLSDRAAPDRDSRRRQPGRPFVLPLPPLPAAYGHRWAEVQLLTGLAVGLPPAFAYRGWSPHLCVPRPRLRAAVTLRSPSWPTTTTTCSSSAPARAACGRRGWPR
ncbi:MAG: TonB-dependent receptor [Caulobacteraceae bacterium]